MTTEQSGREETKQKPRNVRTQTNELLAHHLFSLLRAAEKQKGKEKFRPPDSAGPGRRGLRAASLFDPRDSWRMSFAKSTCARVSEAQRLLEYIEELFAILLLVWKGGWFKLTDGGL